MAIQGNLPGIMALLEQDPNLVSLQVGNSGRDVYQSHHIKDCFPVLCRELAVHDRSLFLNLKNGFHQSVSNGCNSRLHGFFFFSTLVQRISVVDILCTEWQCAKPHEDGGSG